MVWCMSQDEYKEIPPFPSSPRLHLLPLPILILFMSGSYFYPSVWKQEESNGEIYEVRPSQWLRFYFYHCSTSKEWFSSFSSKYFSFAVFPWPLLSLTLLSPPLPSDLRVFEVCCGPLPSLTMEGKSLGNVKAKLQNRFKPIIIYKNHLAKENKGQEQKQNAGIEWGGILDAFSWPLQCFRCALVF